MIQLFLRFLSLFFLLSLFVSVSKACLALNGMCGFLCNCFWRLPVQWNANYFMAYFYVCFISVLRKTKASVFNGLSFRLFQSVGFWLTGSCQKHGRTRGPVPKGFKKPCHSSSLALKIAKMKKINIDFRNGQGQMNPH